MNFLDRLRLPKKEITSSKDFDTSLSSYKSFAFLENTQLNKFACGFDKYTYLAAFEAMLCSMFGCDEDIACSNLQFGQDTLLGENGFVVKYLKEKPLEDISELLLSRLTRALEISLDIVPEALEKDFHRKYIAKSDSAKLDKQIKYTLPQTLQSPTVDDDKDEY